MPPVMSPPGTAARDNLQLLKNSWHPLQLWCALGSCRVGAAETQTWLCLSVCPAEPARNFITKLTNPPQPARLSLNLKFWISVSITEPAEFLINTLGEFRLPRTASLEGAASSRLSAQNPSQHKGGVLYSAAFWFLSRLLHFPVLWFTLTQVQIPQMLTDVKFSTQRSRRAGDAGGKAEPFPLLSLCPGSAGSPSQKGFSTSRICSLLRTFQHLL